MEKIFPYLIALLTLVLGWFLARRKNNAEGINAEVKMIESLIGVWKTEAEMLRKEVTSLRAEVHLLRDENRTLLGKLNKYENAIPLIN